MPSCALFTPRCTDVIYFALLVFLNATSQDRLYAKEVFGKGVRVPTMMRDLYHKFDILSLSKVLKEVDGDLSKLVTVHDRNLAAVTRIKWGAQARPCEGNPTTDVLVDSCGVGTLEITDLALDILLLLAEDTLA
mmetsp:Transcript_4988/g.10383  ORF Transcript_4988/g.10383 Transcript_4988/m.10383 type:complete len:134 (-) Transcript_4988:169-570(-)